DRTRATGDVDDLAIGERTDLEDRRWGPQHPRADRERDEPQGAEPQRSLPLRRLRLACERDVVRVHADRDAALLADALGEADVVGMRVCQHDRTDVVEDAAHRGQLAWQRVPVAGRTGIDDGDAALLLEE